MINKILFPSFRFRKIMRLLHRYFLATAMLFPLLAPAQEKDEELMAWNAARKLEWSDYKGSPDPISDAAASTATYLGIEYNIRSNNFSFKITCMFSKNKSWGRARTEYILSHEQGHFDIAEIFARKLNKRMSEYQFNKNTFQEDLEKIYSDILDEKEKIQNQYDNGTNYSRNKERQAEWLKKIEMLLEELKEFSDYH